MKIKFHLLAVCAGLLISASCSQVTVPRRVAAEAKPAPKEHVFATRPLGIRVSVKMVGPYMEPADLQVICLFKHKPGGDTYLGAAKETDEKLGGILSALRNRGEFVGEAAETILFTPPVGSIPAKR